MLQARAKSTLLFGDLKLWTSSMVLTIVDITYTHCEVLKRAGWRHDQDVLDSRSCVGGLEGNKVLNNGLMWTT